MSDYLSRAADRVAPATAPAVRPRLQSRYEAAPEATPVAVEWEVAPAAPSHAPTATEESTAPAAPSAVPAAPLLAAHDFHLPAATIVLPSSENPVPALLAAPVIPTATPPSAASAPLLRVERVTLTHPALHEAAALLPSDAAPAFTAARAWSGL